VCFKCIVVAVIVVVGDVFAGSKFGGYGTFLPTQARAPSMLANPLRPSHVLEPADSNKEVMELLPFLFYMLFSLAKSGGTSHWC
jgi:hypothetical protein